MVFTDSCTIYTKSLDCLVFANVDYEEQWSEWVSLLVLEYSKKNILESQLFTAGHCYLLLVQLFKQGWEPLPHKWEIKKGHSKLSKTLQVSKDYMLKASWQNY